VGPEQVVVVLSNLNPKSIKKKENKMTPKRILEIYEDMLDRYKQYVADEEVESPYEDFPGQITFYLPPVHIGADDREKLEGWFEPEDILEGTMIARIYREGWEGAAYIFDTAREDWIRLFVSNMLFIDGEGCDFLKAQGF
jgi:hypothetical protein